MVLILQGHQGARSLIHGGDPELKTTDPRVIQAMSQGHKINFLKNTCE